MTPAYLALLVGALSASIISRENLRGIFWVIAAQLAFWLSILYWDFNLPLPMLVAAVFDATIVYYLYKYGKERWEEWLMCVFLLSILTNFAAQAFVLIDANFNIYIYSWALYVLNWLAILGIGMISGFKRRDYARDFVAFSNWSTIFGRERIMARQKEA